jgi:uncharacterized protein YacL
MKKFSRVFATVVLVILLTLMLAFPVLAASPGETSPGMMFTTTPEMLALIAGVVLSLIFSYVPGLNTKFAALDPTYKRLIMLGILVLTAGAIFGLSCASVLTGVTCDQPGLMQMVTILILAVIANQSAYSISPLSKPVRDARLNALLFAPPTDIPLQMGQARPRSQDKP